VHGRHIDQQRRRLRPDIAAGVAHAAAARQYGQSSRRGQTDRMGQCMTIRGGDDDIDRMRDPRPDILAEKRPAFGRQADPVGADGSAKVGGQIGDWVMGRQIVWHASTRFDLS